MKRFYIAFLALSTCASVSSHAEDTQLVERQQYLEESLRVLEKEPNVFSQGFLNWHSVVVHCNAIIRLNPDSESIYKPIAAYANRMSVITDIGDNCFFKSTSSFDDGEMCLLNGSARYVGIFLAKIMRYFKNEYGEPEWYAEWNAVEDLQSAIQQEYWMDNFRTFANQGDPVGMYLMAKIHELRGEYALALRWMRLSANLGLPRAQLTLYRWYLFGDGSEEHHFASIPNPINSRRYLSVGDILTTNCHTNRVAQDSHESNYWALRLWAQSPFDLVIPGWNIVSRKFQKDSIRRREEDRTSGMHEYVKDEKALLAFYKRQAELIRNLNIDTYAVQESYKILYYIYHNAEREDDVSGALFWMDLCERMLSSEEREKALLRARVFKPRLELDATKPLSEAHVDYATRDDERRRRQYIAAQDERPNIPVIRTGLNESRPAIKSTAPTASDSSLIHREMLDEQRRANRAREALEERRASRETLQMFLNEIHRYRKAPMPRPHSYEIRTRYPSVDSDPMAPGSPFNPYIVEPR